jgi:hypothetical protein
MNTITAALLGLLAAFTIAATLHNRTILRALIPAAVAAGTLMMVTPGVAHADNWSGCFVGAAQGCVHPAPHNAPCGNENRILDNSGHPYLFTKWTVTMPWNGADCVNFSFNHAPGTIRIQQNLYGWDGVHQVSFLCNQGPWAWNPQASSYTQTGYHFPPPPPCATTWFYGEHILQYNEAGVGWVNATDYDGWNNIN